MRKFFITLVIIFSLITVATVVFNKSHNGRYAKDGSHEGYCVLDEKYTQEDEWDGRVTQANKLYRAKFHGDEIPDMNISCPEGEVILREDDYYELEEGNTYHIWYKYQPIDGFMKVEHFKEEEFK